jgi:hypothetical protein
MIRVLMLRPERYMHMFTERVGNADIFLPGSRGPDGLLAVVVLGLLVISGLLIGWAIFGP